MKSKYVSLWVTCASLLIAAQLATSSASAAKRSKRKGRKAEEYANVELFDAMKKGDIEVQFIPRDSRSANVLIRNKTEKVLYYQESSNRRESMSV